MRDRAAGRDFDPTRPPRVSIGLPVYNGGRYLRGAIEAILAQTFADFELIICDNASTDQTARVARALADDLDGVEVLRLEQKGRGRALRAAWARSLPQRLVRPSWSTIRCSWPAWRSPATPPTSGFPMPATA